MDTRMGKAWADVEGWVQKRTGTGTEPVQAKRDLGLFFYEWQGTIRLWVEEDPKARPVFVVSFLRTYIGSRAGDSGSVPHYTETCRCVARCSDWHSYKAILEAVTLLPREHGPGACS